VVSHESKRRKKEGEVMSKQANKTKIGIFVLGAMALLVIAIVVLGSGKLFRETFKAVCFFEGPVGGIDVGAPVVFDGVRIGSVTDKGLLLAARATVEPQSRRSWQPPVLRNRDLQNQ
jgi:ABC-type transporter Mla subunit MlaD